MRFYYATFKHQIKINHSTKRKSEWRNGSHDIYVPLGRRSAKLNTYKPVKKWFFWARSEPHLSPVRKWHPWTLTLDRVTQRPLVAFFSPSSDKLTRILLTRVVWNKQKFKMSWGSAPPGQNPYYVSMTFQLFPELISDIWQEAWAVSDNRTVCRLLLRASCLNCHFALNSSRMTMLINLMTFHPGS